MYTFHFEMAGRHNVLKFPNVVCWNPHLPRYRVFPDQKIKCENFQKRRTFGQSKEVKITISLSEEPILLLCFLFF
jgi:hypothetical protein